MKSLRTKAIVLRRTNYGEADRIVQLITENGKKSVIARGVRREKSRLSGGIELFAICDVVIGQGKGELDILTSSRLVVFFKHIMEDYERMQFAYTAINIVSKSSEMVDGSDWYNILSETLAGLDAKNVNFKLIQTWFYLRYSLTSGYELSLWHDINGDKLDSDRKYSYDYAERGLVISQSGLSSEHIKLLRLLSTRSIKVLSQIGGIDSFIDDCLSVVREHAAI